MKLTEYPSKIDLISASTALYNKQADTSDMYAVLRSKNNAIANSPFMYLACWNYLKGTNLFQTIEQWRSQTHSKQLNANVDNSECDLTKDFPSEGHLPLNKEYESSLVLERKWEA